MTDHMLTTIDNPWSPVTNFDEWWMYDSRAGHNTPGLLARLAGSSIELSEADQDSLIHDAMVLICSEIGPGFYQMVEIPAETAAKV